MTAGAASSHPNNRKVDGQAACSMLGSGLCGVQQQQVPCPLLDHLADIASELSEVGVEGFSASAAFNGVLCLCRWLSCMVVLNHIHG